MCRFLSLLALVVTLAPATSAPVPPAPKYLTDDALVGTWGLAWGSSTDGTLWLHSDGSYAEVLSTHGKIVFHGEWWVDAGGALVMHEYRFDPDTGSNYGPLTYRLELKRSGGTLAGAANGCTRVVMTNRR